MIWLGLTSNCFLVRIKVIVCSSIIAHNVSCMVTDAPDIRLIGQPEGDLEENRDTVTLKCIADANPPATIIWRKVGRPEIFSFQVKVLSTTIKAIACLVIIVCYMYDIYVIIVEYFCRKSLNFVHLQGDMREPTLVKQRISSVHRKPLVLTLTSNVSFFSSNFVHYLSRRCITIFFFGVITHETFILELFTVVRLMNIEFSYSTATVSLKLTCTEILLTPALKHCAVKL